jgi:hypothetical protein
MQPLQRPRRSQEHCFHTVPECQRKMVGPSTVSYRSERHGSRSSHEKATREPRAWHTNGTLLGSDRSSPVHAWDKSAGRARFSPGPTEQFLVEPRGIEYGQGPFVGCFSLSLPASLGRCFRRSVMWILALSVAPCDFPSHTVATRRFSFRSLSADSSRRFNETHFIEEITAE